MFGFFNGPEVNRVLFSFHKMNKLLNYSKDIHEINLIAKTELSISKADKEIIQNINLPSNFIAIVLGGEWSYRTYHNWPKVIKGILEKDVSLNIVIVGSSNATKFVPEILKMFADFKIFNCVNQYSFTQTAQIISLAKILLCCDGGLMHAANSMNTTIVALFARLTPEMQLTDSVKAFSVFDKNDVNNILPEKIVNKYMEASNLSCNRHLDE